MFSTEILEEIDDHINRKKETPTLMTWARKINRKEEEKEKLVVVTPYSIYCFKKVGDGIEFGSVCYFYNVLEMKKQHYRFKIRFKDNIYHFIGEEAPIIAEMCAMQVYSIFYPEEVPFISRKSFPPNAVPTPLNRFLAKEATKGSLPSQEMIDALKDYIDDCDQLFNIGYIKNLWNHLGGVLFAIKTLPYITQVIIPRIEYPAAWDTLITFWQENVYCRWVTISLPVFPDEGFRKFAFFIAEHPNENIEILEFKNLNIYYSTISLLYNAFQKNEIQKIIFNHCNMNMTEQKLTQILGAARRRSHIRGFGFISMESEKIQTVIPKISILKHISLISMGLEIAPLLKKLLPLGLYTINLSGNKANEDLKGEISITTEPYKLSLNSITWKPKTLYQVISKVKRSQGWCSLELANAHLDDEEWEEFDKKISGHSPEKIDSFNWANNHISQEIMDFLVKGQLNFICLAGIDITKFKPTLSKFHCKYLDIHGTSEFQLEGGIIDVMEGLTTSMIDFVNINSNNIGVEHLEKLSELIEKFSSLRCIALDDNNFTDIGALRTLGDRFLANKKFYIWFPERDIAKITLTTHSSVATNLKDHFHLPKHSRRGTLAGDEWMNSIYGFNAEDDDYKEYSALPPVENKGKAPSDDDDEEESVIDCGRDNESSDGAYLDLS